MAARIATLPGASRTRLALLLLLAPALVWLVGLIVLPHLELAALSLRARVAGHSSGTNGFLKGLGDHS